MEKRTDEIRPQRTASYRLQPVAGEAAGFAQIGRLYNFAAASSAKVIIVDCSRLSWLDAHLTAGYYAVIQLIKTLYKKDVAFANLIPKVQEILEHHGLMGFKPANEKRSVIPVTRFQPGEAKKFAQFTQDHFNRMPVPSMSDAVEEKFFEGIDELFSNAELHSNTKLGMFACGQFFPRKNILDFTVVDLGVGFQEVINRVTSRDFASDEAIDWAMSGNNTTRSGDIPGGLGLKLLKGFIGYNGGRLTIVSHGGRWCFGPDGIVRGAMATSFPGTAITLEINTADTNMYYMKEEVPHDGEHND